MILLEVETVVADTGAARRESLRRALAAEGVSLADAEYAEVCAGLPVRAAARAALGLHGRGDDETLADLVTLRAEREFAERIAAGGVTLAPAARDFLTAAAGRARLAVVTRARRAEADALLALTGLGDLFACVVTADDVAADKPSPAGYHRALERLARGGDVGAVAGAAVALEDALPGIRAARAAGVRCVAVGGLAAHAALEADAAVASLDGQTPASLAALAAPGASSPPGASGARRR